MFKMITDGQKFNYLAVIKSSALLKKLTSKHRWKFHCLNCFHLFRIKTMIDSHEKICKNCIYCESFMPDDKTKNWNIIMHKTH